MNDQKLVTNKAYVFNLHSLFFLILALWILSPYLTFPVYQSQVVATGKSFFQLFILAPACLGASIGIFLRKRHLGHTLGSAVIALVITQLFIRIITSNGIQPMLIMSTGTFVCILFTFGYLLSNSFPSHSPVRLKLQFLPSRKTPLPRQRQDTEITKV